MVAEQVWEVVGGVDKGGILVRQGKEVDSEKEADRLSTGALVKQLSLDSDRLQYELLTGTGPKVGWVSISIKGKELVTKTDKRPSELIVTSETMETANAEEPVKPTETSASVATAASAMAVSDAAAPEIFDGFPEMEPPLEGESEASAGFVHRADDDPLRDWIPLRQLTARGKHSPVICMGPPSVSAVDWTAPDAFGAWGGSEKTGNKLTQLALMQNHELLIAQLPTSMGALKLDAWAAKLAPRLLDKLDKVPWMGIGVSVGCWLLAAFLRALERLGAEGRQAAQLCICLHMVGFPPPTAGLNFSRPAGMPDADWTLAGTLSGPYKMTVPNRVLVYHLLSDSAISKDRVFEWFGLEFQDGSTRSAYPFFGLQGDHTFLQQPRHRTEFFWSLSLNGFGPLALADGIQPDLGLEAYQKAALAMGHGDVSSGLIDEHIDTVVLAFDQDPNLKRIPNVNYQISTASSGEPTMKPYVQSNWTSGPCAHSIGLDIRMWWDTSITPADGSKVGTRIVCAVRFGIQPCIYEKPGNNLGIHGGAIQSVMDEITAQCVRINAVPGCTTRHIQHTISAKIVAFNTYSADCVIESTKNNDCIYVSKATLKDPLGKAVCISKADMVDLSRMAQLQLG